MLSAVDAHTARHLVYHCLTGPLAEGRVIVLVSHHASLCAPVAVQVVHMDDGSPVFVGSGSDYLAADYCDVDNNLDSNLETEGPSFAALEKGREGRDTGWQVGLSNQPVGSHSSDTRLIKSEKRVSHVVSDHQPESVSAKYLLSPREKVVQTGPCGCSGPEAMVERCSGQLHVVQ